MAKVRVCFCGCRLLAPRLRYLCGDDLLSVLRVFPRVSCDDKSVKQYLTTAVNARFRELRSWRNIQEMQVSVTLWTGDRSSMLCAMVAECGCYVS